MAVSALSAARSLCEIRGWSVSNLELQKLLYIAHMIHLGKTGGHPLVNESFEAWDYGPVLPPVYHHTKGFGSGPVRNVFHWIAPVPEGQELASLREAVDLTRGMTAGKLVAITHWGKGAWSKCYRSGVRGIPIPNQMILDEFRERTAA